MKGSRKRLSVAGVRLVLCGLLWMGLPWRTVAGTGTPLPTVADLLVDGLQPGERFGASLATAGDVNGDGYSDVIVGMPDYDNGANTDAGRVMVFLGSATGLSGTFAWIMNGTQTNVRFGHSVSTAGDVNGDGYSDIIIGAPGHAGQGAVFVYHGSATGLQLTPAWTTLGGEAGAGFGSCVALAGDVNNDNVSDILVGAPLANELGTDRGKVYCYRGALGTGLVAAPLWTWSGTQDNAQLGFSVAGAGDLNGDGRSDVVVGEPYYDASLTDRGRITVFHGNGSGLALSVTRDGPSSNAHFGYAVSSAGDMNGDGYSDLL
ncbi:MAG TPA: integrin alpha, partial [Flavobacteriales bacterium]|nr:integrin alpha [Flavobacteriales bacterium]